GGAYRLWRQTQSKICARHDTRAGSGAPAPPRARVLHPATGRCRTCCMPPFASWSDGPFRGGECRWGLPGAGAQRLRYSGACAGVDGAALARAGAPGGRVWAAPGISPAVVCAGCVEPCSTRDSRRVCGSQARVLAVLDRVSTDETPCYRARLPPGWGSPALATTALGALVPRRP